MNVLSLFDGISCARVGLDRAKIPVNTYYASEIDKNAIKVSEKNYPDIVRLGDVRTIHTLDVQIDLLIGGSPCQDLSIAKKDRQGLEGNRSSLFWEYVRILKVTKPRYFILENVASMPQKDKDIITKTLGVEPVLFNASLVSAQCRKRLFWTNIQFELPEDKGIKLKDILQPDVDERFEIKKQLNQTAQTGRNETKKLGYVGEHDHQAKRVYDDGKLPALNVVCNSMVKVGYIGEGEQYGQGGQAHRVYDTEGKTPTLSSFAPLIKLGHIGNTDGQANRVYDSAGKSVTLSANGGGLGAKTGLYQVLNKRQQANLRSIDDKAHCLTSTNFKGSQANGTTLIQNETEQRIRKLTPIECERLQGLPDNYTDGIAITNRYKCLGNAFNVDVVSHILNHIQK